MFMELWSPMTDDHKSRRKKKKKTTPNGQQTFFQKMKFSLAAMVITPVKKKKIRFIKNIHTVPLFQYYVTYSSAEKTTSPQRIMNTMSLSGSCATKYHVKLTPPYILETKRPSWCRCLERLNTYCMFGIKFIEAESSICCSVSASSQRPIWSHVSIWTIKASGLKGS